MYEHRFHSLPSQVEVFRNPRRSWFIAQVPVPFMWPLHSKQDNCTGLAIESNKAWVGTEFSFSFGRWSCVECVLEFLFQRGTSSPYRQSIICPSCIVVSVTLIMWGRKTGNSLRYSTLVVTAMFLLCIASNRTIELLVPWSEIHLACCGTALETVVVVWSIIHGETEKLEMRREMWLCSCINHAKSGVLCSWLCMWDIGHNDVIPHLVACHPCAASPAAFSTFDILLLYVWFWFWLLLEWTIALFEGLCPHLRPISDLKGLMVRTTATTAEPEPLGIIRHTHFLLTCFFHPVCN